MLVWLIVSGLGRFSFSTGSNQFKNSVMFSLQLKYETLRLLRSPALWLLLIFLVASVSFGIYNGMQRTAAKRQSVGEMLVKQQTDLEKQKMQADSIARNLIKSNSWWLDPTNVIVVGGMWRGAG
ncbi:MAG: hypothetical protein IPL27_04540 [Lewinellaceae bacterium]|nr:hypothetical protein [Lewinellaceae bacterium]